MLLLPALPSLGLGAWPRCHKSCSPRPLSSRPHIALPSATLSDLASGLDPQSGAPAPPESWANIENDELTMWLHSRKRLFGGAQYWRALHEFMLGAAEGPSEEVNTVGVLPGLDRRAIAVLAPTHYGCRKSLNR
mmetsp:Transcript_4514/g.12700  ORF Transcript_4514/g.12700 Transcript_4514/m.12700 type:complete len:134 (-) Transcript_4514:1271-1672(-)